jgi:tRNA(Ile)-lysidine synthase
MLEYELEKSFERVRDLLSADKQLKVVLGVSGGCDSVVLLHLLWRFQERLNLEFVVAHFDHALRETSFEDQQFVRELAAKYRLPYFSSRAESSPQTENIEHWARTKRYQFLTSVQDEIEADLIATAHHANDEVETILFRMITGRLAQSVYGIAEVDLNRSLIRPLLAVRRKEIESYAREHHLSFVTDETNFDLNYSRNFLRNKIIPEIEDHFELKLTTTILNVSARLSEDEDYLWEEARKIFKLRNATSKHSGKTDREYFQGIPQALRWRVLLLLAESDLGEVVFEVSAENYKNLSDLVSENGRFELDLGAKISAQFSPELGLQFCFKNS